MFQKIKNIATNKNLNLFTLLDKNKVLEQHDFFRIFATTNTVGLGDTTGLYHGTQQINQGQMDRWNIVTTLNYLSLDKEMDIVLSKNKTFNNVFIKLIKLILIVLRLLNITVLIIYKDRI